MAAFSRYIGSNQHPDMVCRRSRQAILDHPLHGSSLEGKLLAELRQLRAGGRPSPKQGGPVTLDPTRRFVAANHRAVTITRRSSGGLQTSPVLVGTDSDGKVIISTRETAYKVRNLRRHPPPPSASSPTTSSAPGSRSTAPQKSCPSPRPWTGLIDDCRRISGEHPDWDDYQRAMVDQRRVLNRLTIDNIGPTHAG